MPDLNSEKKAKKTYKKKDEESPKKIDKKVEERDEINEKFNIESKKIDDDDETVQNQNSGIDMFSDLLKKNKEMYGNSNVNIGNNDDS
jgi:hypothetical protein